LLLLLALGACPLAKAQNVIIIANREFHAEQITSSDLRDIFTGVRSRLRDGSPVAPVTLKGGPAHEVFLRNNLSETPEEFRTTWRKAVFTGQGAMPKTFDSETALIQYVATTPGAIGYVSRVSTQDAVKLLLVVHR
jgi:ABC-type phosphate transport system substrate-binding protein